MFRRYDGVQAIMVVPKSLISMSWRSVLPPEMGTVSAPSFSAP